MYYLYGIKLLIAISPIFILFNFHDLIPASGLLTFLHFKISYINIDNIVIL